MASTLRWVLLVTVACGGHAAPRTASLAAPSDDEWRDPADDLPASAAERAALADAVVNPAATPLAIVHATILTAAGARYQPGTIVLAGGAITYVGDDGAELPRGTTVIDGTGKFVTPGLIDAHSHLGVYGEPQVEASADGNETTGAVTGAARAEYGYWPADPALSRARAGGVTTALILPGSANLIGGRGFTVMLAPGRTVDDVRFPGAPPTVKMACGENPKRTYGERGGPQTRMAEYAAFRTAFQQAAEYRARWTAYRRAHGKWLARRAAGKDKPSAAADPPPRDLGLETLAAVLDGRALVQIHCYRADEMAKLIAIADEYGFHIRAFHHALEAYKIRDLLAAHGIAVATWADWWGYKLEMIDGIPEGAALVHEAGARVAIHSDSESGIQRLNQEAAKAMASGRAAGVAITDDQALRWITANPAWILGIDAVTGTLEIGKRADVVIWSGDPFSVYSRAERVIQAGEVTYDRARGLEPSDLELGTSGLEEDAR